MRQEQGGFVRDDLIRMAIQCNLITTVNRESVYMDALAEFAELVAGQERKWIGFTQEEVKNLILSFDWRAPVEHFVASLEAQLKEKNCG